MLLLDEYGSDVGMGHAEPAPPSLLLPASLASPLPLWPPDESSTTAADGDGEVDGSGVVSPPALLLCWFGVPESVLGLGLRAVLRERLAGLLGLGLSMRYGLRLGFGVLFGLGVCSLGSGRLGFPLWTSKRARRGPTNARWPSLRTPLLLRVAVGGTCEAFVALRCGLVAVGERSVARLGANTVFSVTAVAAAECVPHNNAKPTQSAGDVDRNGIVQPRARNTHSAAHAMGSTAELWSRDMAAGPVSAWVTVRAWGIVHASVLSINATHTTDAKMRTNVANFQGCHNAAAHP